MIGKFSIDLILWYKENKRSLPWRETKDVYKVWVSEIILQQTRVNQGLNYYLRFIELFPTVHHLANASEDAILKCWQGLGYYSRARNMHAAAKYVVQELNGVFPDNYNDLLKLKGIGTYTAAAISSICFNEHQTVVDGNVFRVLTRIYNIDTPINTNAGKKQIEELAHQLNDVKEHGDFNQALMEFGALQCTPKNPDCMQCIFNDRCLAYQKRKVDSLPVKEKKLKIKKRYLNFIFIVDKNKNTIIQKRLDNDIWNGLYQFPLIETEKEEDNILGSDAFKKMINGVDITVRSNHQLKHVLTHQRLFINIIQLEVKDVNHLNGNDYQITSLEELSNYAFPKPLTSFIH